MLSKAWNSWRVFWFEPQPVEPLALYRILFGLLVLQMAVLHVGADFLTWYGSHAVISTEAIAHSFWQGQPRFDILLLFSGNDLYLTIYFLTFILAAAFLTVGFATRYSAIWVCLGLISLHHHMPYNINGGDAFMRLASMFLAASPCGEALSIDNYLRRKRGITVTRMHSPWCQRMIQVQLALAYCTTFLWKASGQQWQDGTAVYYATRLDDMIRLQIPWLLDNLVILKGLTWYTLFIECASWTLIWFRPLRYYVLAGVFLLHFGIDLFISLPVFQWVFIATLVTFIYPEDLDKLLGNIKEFAKPRVLRFSNYLLSWCRP
jgi:hypothetical protein